MKKRDSKPDIIRNSDDLTKRFSKDQILGEKALQSVRGGDGDGGSDIILIPKPPQGGGN
jgi:hypothetical protein